MVERRRERGSAPPSGGYGRSTAPKTDAARIARVAVLAVLPAVLSMAVALAFPAPGRGERPWYREYRARRRVTLPRDAKPGDTVLLRLGTAGLTRPDARDVRLVAEHRKAIPVDILEVGPGDALLMRFKVYEPSLRLDAYFGRPGALAPKRLSRQLPGGLLLELWELPDGGCETWSDARKLLGAAGKRLGVLTPRSIFLGLPPLGRSQRYLARYSGHLRVGVAGEHTFETVSDGASFLLVGGKLIATWPGFHSTRGYRDPAERAKHSGRVNLKEGLHSIDYVVATRRGGVHVAAWARPGDERTRPISPRHFLPWKWASAGVLEIPEGTATADFRWRIASDTNSDADRHDLAEVEFRFDGYTGGRQIAAVHWEFGDGQKGEGERVDHVYLEHGLYEVRMRLALAAGTTLTARRKVMVRFESLERRNLDVLLGAYYGTTRSYDLATLPPGHLPNLVWLLRKDYRWESDLWNAVDTWYERRLEPDTAGIAGLGLRRAAFLIAEGIDEARARVILEVLADSAPKEKERAEARAWLAWLSARDRDSPSAGAAVETLLRLFEDGGTGDAGRRAGLLVCRAYLARARIDEARKILERLETEPGFRRHEGPRELAESARRLSFDNLLKRKDYREAREELERWEWELPTALLTGDLQVSRARYYRARGRLEEALGELQAVEELPSAGRILPRALLLAAEILDSQEKRGEARKRLERVVEEFPERPESRAAASRLETLTKEEGRPE